MKTVILEIKDSKFEVKKKEDDEAIDEQHCLEVLDKINQKDYSGTKKVSSDELFKELEL